MAAGGRQADQSTHDTCIAAELPTGGCSMIRTPCPNCTCMPEVRASTHAIGGGSRRVVDNFCTCKTERDAVSHWVWLGRCVHGP